MASGPEVVSNGFSEQYLFVHHCCTTRLGGKEYSTVSRMTSGDCIMAGGREHIYLHPSAFGTKITRTTRHASPQNMGRSGAKENFVRHGKMKMFTVSIFGFQRLRAMWMTRPHLQKDCIAISSRMPVARGGQMALLRTDCLLL